MSPRRKTTTDDKRKTPFGRRRLLYTIKVLSPLSNRYHPTNTTIPNRAPYDSPPPATAITPTTVSLPPLVIITPSDDPVRGIHGAVVLYREITRVRSYCAGDCWRVIAPKRRAAIAFSGNGYGIGGRWVANTVVGGGAADGSGSWISDRVFSNFTGRLRRRRPFNKSREPPPPQTRDPPTATGRSADGRALARPAAET